MRYFQVSTTFSRCGSRNFWSGKLLFSHKHHPSPSRRPRLHVIIPWPLTFYGCTRKGYTLGTSSSVSAGRRSRGKYCFASRGEYPKTITFFNIPGILFSGKMQRAFHWKNQPVKKWYTILSMSQTSVRSGREDPKPPGPSPRIRHWIRDTSLTGVNTSSSVGSMTDPTLATGVKTSLKKWVRALSIFIAIILNCLLYSPEVEVVWWLAPCRK